MNVDIPADDVLKRLGDSDTMWLVDVRSVAEYRAGHLPGAIHFPFWLLPFRYKVLGAAKDKSLVVYCEHGPRAVMARQMLHKRGFADVRCLRGHMHAWRRERRPLVTGTEPGVH
jgi:hydroxyacylglutathione hydrolase